VWSNIKYIQYFIPYKVVYFYSQYITCAFWWDHTTVFVLCPSPDEKSFACAAAGTVGIALCRFVLSSPIIYNISLSPRPLCTIRCQASQLDTRRYCDKQDINLCCFVCNIIGNFNMKFQRLKDRAAVIHPQGEGVPVTARNLARQRRYHAPHEEEIDWEDTNLPPAYVSTNPDETRVRRVEKRLVSYELKNRKEAAPCIEDLLKIREEHLRELAREAKREKKRQEQAELMSKLELALQMGNVDDVLEDEDPETPDIDEDLNQEEFKKRALDMKEKKVVFQRGSRVIHEPLTSFQRVLRTAGIYWKKDKIKRDKYSRILPWMYLGDRSMAANLNFLVGQGFTHILNVSKEVCSHACLVCHVILILHLVLC
jgi:hypothetical protein